MNAEEKIKRLLQEDWEIHGDPKMSESVTQDF